MKPREVTVEFVVLPEGKVIRSRRGHLLRVSVVEVPVEDDPLLLNRGKPNWPHKFPS